MAGIFQDGSRHLYDCLIWVISVSNQSFFMMQNSNLELWNWPEASFYLTTELDNVQDGSHMAKIEIIITRKLSILFELKC